MKRGFTLIELMVVISVIAVLSSVVLSATSAGKAKARDSQRTQEVHQIDLAVQLYKSNHNGDAPNLGGTCGVINSVVQDITGCVAISTAAASGPWDNFLLDLHPYLPSNPKDPCSSDCGQLGYTYYAPRAIEYQCQHPGPCTTSNTELGQSYKLYAPLERATSTSSDTIPPSVPTVNYFSYEQPNIFLFQFGGSTDTGGSGFAGYKVYLNNTFVTDATENQIIDYSFPYGATYCYSVAAFDYANNVSARTADTCLTNTDAYVRIYGDQDANNQGSETISSGQSTLISWYSSNESNCHGTSNPIISSAYGWTNAPSSGSFTLTPAAETTLSLMCTSAGGGQDSANFTIHVQ